MQEDHKKFGKALQLLRAVILFAFALFAVNAYSASKTILVVGDSLSAEYGLARGTGWVTLLEKRLQEQKIDAQVANASISGETTSGGRSRLQSLLDRNQPAVVIIELGANDGLRGLPVTAAEANLDAMIFASQKAKAKVLLIGMQIPPNYGRTYAEKFSSMYTKLAQDKKTALAPFLLEGFGNRQELFQADRIHPTAQAQPIMLDNVWPYLKPLLVK